MEEIKTGKMAEAVNANELVVYYDWKSPLRVFKRRDREFWTTVLAIVFLVGLILFFVKEWFLIAAIIALVFVYYVLSTVEPEEVEHQLTNRGVVFGGVTYPWLTIARFWFDEKYGQRKLNIELTEGLVNRIVMLIGKGSEEKIKEIMLKFTREEKAEDTFMDKAADWMQKKIPLESETKTNGYNKATTPPEMTTQK